MGRGDATRRTAGRGRVVMLVDNDVERDSRVQKQARSMAEHGWDVVLLGRGKPGQQRRWRIGDARVRLVPTPIRLGRRPTDLRRARLRDPLAYPLTSLPEHRRQVVRARQADLRLRRIDAGSDRLRLVPARAATAALARWVELRSRRTEKLSARRAAADSPLDRFTTGWWRRTMGDRAWRRLDPGLWDFELAYGPVVDRLKPDLVHANDFRMLGVGARAIARAREQGRDVKLVWDAHEYLPGILPWDAHPRWHLAQVAHEREYARAADAVVTVSAELGALLRETHDLPEDPTVVLNAPYAAHAHSEGAPSIRDRCGLGPETPLMVYSGVAKASRGLDVMVEALPALDDVVCALVVPRPDNEYVAKLLARAGELGVAERMRVLPYVPYDQVVPFLSSADIGVIPLQHWPNHEIALITKFFEYSHARLPIVVSDVEAMAATTRETGQGEVFPADDVAGFAEAVGKVLEDPKRYRSAYDDPALLARWTWESQAEILDGVYQRLLTAARRS